MQAPIISVIIPVYNVERYLHQCVDSVLTQTYSNLEIILVDDGSPDNCPAICDEYAQKDKRIKVIHKENGGLSSARNTGLDAATGDFIYFLDSDDYIGDTTISSLYEHIHDNKQITIAIGYFTALKDGFFSTYNEDWLFDSPRIIESNDFANRMLKERSNHAATAKLYRKEIFKDLRFQIGKKNEDTLLAMDLIPIIEANQYQSIDVPIYTYYYRLHNQSICRSSSDPFIWHIVRNSETIIQKYPNRFEIVKFLRNRQLDAIIATLSDYIKQKNRDLFYTYHIQAKQFPTSFAIKNQSLKVFCYFLLLKYAPKVLILREKLRQYFLH